ncbi:MAG: serine acetyltransferase [Deltaproteobacteria bacterium]|nr:serine acetyltransferase [Deltaproteobacteria bacterium]
MSLKDITARIVKSYREGGGINHVGGRSLPSTAAIARILHELEELLFPGFSSEERLTEDTVEWVTGNRIAFLTGALEEQVRLDLAFQREVPVDSVRPDAARIVFELLEGIPALRAELTLDVQALLDGDPAARAKEEIILAYPGLRAVLVHRVAHRFWSAGARLVARMMSEDLHGRTGIDIHPGATIGRSFYIDHGTGVVIGETTVIGDHVKLYQGVSLGALSVSRRLQDQKRHPTLEDHVTIYAGATILGGDTVVGHHSVVGGNVWLVSSVPPYSVVEHDSTMRVGSRRRPDGSDFDPGI